MKYSRRSFFKGTMIASAGVLLSPLMASVYARKNFGFGACTSFINSEMLKRIGYDYIEEGVRKYLVPEKSDKMFNEILSRAKKSSLPIRTCNGFLPGTLKAVGPEAKHQTILVFANTAFQRAEEVGVSTIVFGSGRSRNIPEGFSKQTARSQFMELVAQMAPIANNHGVTLVLEALNSEECNFINLVSEGGEMVREINHPGFQLLADSYHMRMENESAESIIKYGDIIKHVHIAELQDRAAPGVNDEDFSSFFKALKKIKYQGKISIECRWKNMETEAAPALKYMRQY